MARQDLLGQASLTTGTLAMSLYELLAIAQIDQLRQLALLERLGQPEDIASVVPFLARPAGGWVNGQVLRANGGFA